MLSGEVEGLKPPAVADKPMEPRLFIVNRSAEATELVKFTMITWQINFMNKYEASLGFM